jgi:hypothetical protein
MKRHRRFLPGLFLLVLPAIAIAQVRSTKEFQITKISKDFITTPQFSFAGSSQHPPSEPNRWLEVEVEFAAGPEITQELTLKYFILFNGTLLTGEVTHTNVLAGREHRSVMYIAPRTLGRFAGNRAMTPNSVQNIAVQIVQQGTVKDESSLGRTAAQWYSALPAVSGFVLNKNETPFAPLYWDRYEQIKSSGR